MNNTPFYRIVAALVFSCFLVSQPVQAMTVTQHPISFGYKKTARGRIEKRSVPIDTVIVHATYNKDAATQTIQSALSLWKRYGVAPHYVIDYKGDVYRIIPDAAVAFHAGKSALPDGSTNVNSRSIGIEVLYPQKESPSDAQYEALRELIASLQKTYRIRYVLGHDAIAPGRKVDPWNFDWKQLSDVRKALPSQE